MLWLSKERTDNGMFSFICLSSSLSSKREGEGQNPNIFIPSKILHPNLVRKQKLHEKEKEKNKKQKPTEYSLDDGQDKTALTMSSTMTEAC